MQTPEQEQIVLYINMICTPFSLAGVIYMIYSYFKGSTKNFTSKLVFCLALSDLLITLVDLLEIFYPTAENCTVIGFLRVTGIYSNMLWTTQILAVLYVQFVWEFAGVDKTYPYLVASNILLSLAPNVLTLYDMNFGGTLYFTNNAGECFIGPQSSFMFILIIPFSILLTMSIFMTIRVYLVFKEMATSLGNIEYKSLFMYPAIFVLLDVPMSVDYAMQHQFFWLTAGCLAMYKSIGLINALQFRRASNSKEKYAKETQQDLILRTLSHENESSLSSA